MDRGFKFLGGACFLVACLWCNAEALESESSRNLVVQNQSRGNSLPIVPGGAPPQEPELDGSLMAEYSQARQLIEAGRLSEAKAILERLSKKIANQPEIQNALGVLYRKGGDLGLALEAYAKAVENKPEFAPAIFNMAIVYREQGDFSKAEQAYQRVLQISPNLGAAHLNLAILYDLYFNRPSDALRHYRKFESLGGTNEMIPIWISDLERRLSPRQPGGAPPAGPTAEIGASP